MTNSANHGLSLLLEQCVRRTYQREGPDDLHPVQWAALRYYDRAGQLSRTVSGLARFLGITKGPASRTTSRLLRRGYLNSEVNQADRRAPCLNLTEKGRQALRNDPIWRLASAIDNLSGDEKSVLALGLEVVMNGLLEEERDAEGNS